MANTTTSAGPIVNISSMDSDWTGEQRPLNSIQFNPGAASDKIVVKHKDADGPVIYQSTADGESDETIKYFYGLGLQPFIDYDKCTLSTGFLIIVMYGS